MAWVDEREEITIRTTWCDFHAPDVWKMVARARQRAEARKFDEQDPMLQNQLLGWPA
jgi:hypothetical protein